MCYGHLLAVKWSQVQTLRGLDHLGRKILASMLPKPLREPLQAGYGGADAAPSARAAEHSMAGVRAWTPY
jgi:hypothetical protein